MAYPTPDDIEAVDDVEWYLVAIPKDDAYRRAALDAYTSMADQWRWGMESQSPDAPTIEQHWLAAIATTLELYGMNPITTIIGHIDELESKLDAIANRQTCCDGVVTYGPVTPRANPDGYDYYDTSFPTTWGESETPADVDEWRDLVCGYAHTWLDWMVAVGANIDAAVVDGLLTIGVIVSVLGALATGGLGVFIAAAVAGTVFKEILTSWTEDLFTDAAAAIESARASIICAFLAGDVATLESLIESTVGSSAWLLLYKWVDYETSINTGLYGEVNGQYVTPRLGEDCYCAPASNWGAVANAEWRDGTLAETTSSPYTTASTITDNSIDYDLTITVVASNWAPIVTAYPPTVGAGETIIGVAWRLSQGYTDGGINDPGGNLIRFEGQVMAAEWTGLYYSNDDLAYKTAIDVNNTFDYELAQTQAQIEADRPLDFYCRRGTGQPIGSGEATVIDIQWLVDLG